MPEPGAAEFQPKPSPPHFCHLIPGISGTAEIWSGLKKDLEKSSENGQPVYDTVVAHDSSISGKEYNPRHFEFVGRSILNHIEEVKKTGGKVDILSTSLATSDLVEIIKAIEIIKNDPKFFERPENTEAIRFILISPWGFTKGYSEAFSSIWRFGKLLYEMTPGGLDMGFNSLQLIKPLDVDTSALKLAVTAVDPKRVQELEGYPEITTLDSPSLATQSQEYFDKLSDEKKRRLTEIDLEIKNAIAQKNLPEFKKSLKARGTLLYKHIWNIAGSKEFDDNQPVDITTSMRTLGQLALSIRNYGPSILQSTFFGKPYQRFMKLIESGVEIKFIVPELDIVIPASFIKRFIDEATEKGKGAKISAINERSMGHTGPYSINREPLVNAIK